MKTELNFLYQNLIRYFGTTVFAVVFLTGMTFTYGENNDNTTQKKDQHQNAQPRDSQVGDAASVTAIYISEDTFVSGLEENINGNIAVVNRSKEIEDEPIISSKPVKLTKTVKSHRVVSKTHREVKSKIVTRYHSAPVKARWSVGTADVLAAVTSSSFHIGLPPVQKCKPILIPYQASIKLPFDFQNHFTSQIFKESFSVRPPPFLI